MIVDKVISGGQTGADYGGLLAAEEIGIPTGGWAPHGWRTDAGPNPELGSRFGLKEHPSKDYPPRTRANVKESDVTLIFGNANSTGSALTKSYCVGLNKAYIIVSWGVGKYNRLPLKDEISLFKMLLYGLKKTTPNLVLNVAGNREKRNPGIEQAIKEFLILALKDV